MKTLPKSRAGIVIRGLTFLRTIPRVPPVFAHQESVRSQNLPLTVTQGRIALPGLDYFIPIIANSTKLVGQQCVYYCG
jgi:hypothetical protein